jgi:ribosomal protein S18 acetylase RimI-like enzyme
MPSKSSVLSRPIALAAAICASLVNRANAATWIAEEDERMAGFAIVVWAKRTRGITAYIQTIEVAPEARGRGIGRELLGRIEELRARGGSSPDRAARRGRKHRAIRLYEAQGYRCEGRQENYYPHGRAALIYGKRLDSVSMR